MAEVPYQPAATERPTTEGIPGPRVDTPIGAFGGTIAEAITRAGGQIGAGANELFSRAFAIQEMRDQSEAKDMSVGIATQMGQLRDQYMQNKGANAAPALAEYQKNVLDLRQKALASARNPYIRRYLDNDITNRLNRDIDFAGTHAATETSKSYIDSAKARIDLAMHDAETHWGDADGFERAKDNVKSENASLAGAQGWTPEQLKAQNYDDLAALNFRRLRGQAITDPFGARAYYNAHADEFGKFKPQAEAMLQGQEANVGSRQIEQRITNGTYDERLIAQESGGDIHAVSKTHAAGLYQFEPGTWSDVRSKHPELNLPPTVQQATAAQQTAAQHVFTAENQKALQDAGIEPNQQNTYLAHFLGVEGAKRVINGMAQDPNQPITNLVGDKAIAGNAKQIFFNPDGTPRTAKEFYDYQTRRFAGPGPLTPDSGANWLQEALAAGRAQAVAINPNNPALLDNTLNRIRNNYSIFHTAVRQANIDDRDSLVDLITDHGSWNNPIISMDAISENPVLRQKFDHLPVPMQQEVSRWIDKAVHRTNTPTPEMNVTFEKLHGAIASLDPAAVTADLTQYKLTNLQMAKLKSYQLAAARRQAMDRTLQRAMGVTATYRKGAQIISGSDDEKQWIGRLDGYIEDWKQRNPGKELDNDTMLNWGSQLAQEVGHWYTFSAQRAYQDIPSDFTDEFSKAWRKRYNADPDPRQIAHGYQLHLLNPDAVIK